MISKGVVSEIPTPLAQEGSFFSTLFLVPKKDGGQRPVINLKNLNSFINAPHFKMEGIHTLKSLLRKGDWLVKIDNPHKTTTQKVPVFPIRKQSLPVQLSPIRPGLQLSGDTVGGIHRRHSPNGGDQAEGQRPRVRPDTPSPMHNKPGEDNPTAITVPRIPRFHGGYHQNGAKSPNSKNEKNSGGVSTTIMGGACNMPRPLKVDWQNECHKPSNSTSSSFLQEPTDRPGISPKGREPGLRDNPCIVSRQQGGTNLVGHTDDKLEWQNAIDNGARPDHRIRCQAGVPLIRAPVQGVPGPPRRKSVI